MPAQAVFPSRLQTSVASPGIPACGGLAKHRQRDYSGVVGRSSTSLEHSSSRMRTRLILVDSVAILMPAPHNRKQPTLPAVDDGKPGGQFASRRSSQLLRRHRRIERSGNGSVIHPKSVP